MPENIISPVSPTPLSNERTIAEVAEVARDHGRPEVLDQRTILRHLGLRVVRHPRGRCGVVERNVDVGVVVELVELVGNVVRDEIQGGLGRRDVW